MQNYLFNPLDVHFLDIHFKKGFICYDLQVNCIVFLTMLSFFKISPFLPKHPESSLPVPFSSLLMSPVNPPYILPDTSSSSIHFKPNK